MTSFVSNTNYVWSLIVIMKQNKFLLLLLLPFVLQACIGEDVIFDTIAERIEISNPIDSLRVGDTYAFEFRYFNSIGQEENINVNWTSTDPSVIQVDDEGNATGLTEGLATVIAEGEASEGLIHDSLMIVVGDRTSQTPVTERKGTIKTTSSYRLEGSFTLVKTPSGLALQIEDDYRASSALPGLYLYLTNNPNTINGSFEVGEVEVFRGAHNYQIEGVDISEYNYLLYYCKPFGVKVGDAEIE